MRIAHFSDPHVLCLEAATASRLFNKRITGYLNLRLRRGHQHSPAVLGALLADLAGQAVDHYVITGDLTNLALEAEFERAASLLAETLGAPADRVTLVPGNHDVYTRGAERSMRFSTYFADVLASDCPELGVVHGAGRFPVVKLRGPAAFIGLSTAVARPPFIASGKIGRLQLDALARVLEHPEVRKRTPVIALHHPPRHPGSLRKRLMNGLVDGATLLSQLAPLRRGLVLHGHLHRRLYCRLPTAAGYVDVAGATSASLADPNPIRIAGYNLYELDESGAIRPIQARVYDPATAAFRSAAFADVAQSI